MKKILMCRPDHFRVDYVINPWMKAGSVDQQLAVKQWEALVGAYEDLGIRVEVIDQDDQLPDMVFATDQGIVMGRRFIASNFCFDERRGETQHYFRWFSSHGYECQLLRTGCFEGGDFIFFRNSCFLGTGFRSSFDVVPELERVLDKMITPLELINPQFYHLDTCLFPLNKDTVFYYPKAFSPAAIATLKRLVPNLIEFTKRDVQGFCANSVVIGDTVLMNKGNPHFKKTTKNLGYETKELDMSEFVKAGGGIHCLTLPMQYAETNSRQRSQKKGSHSTYT
jgi:N-dimethylarginine dimethylaminohydrolase